jgi:hypothetical protein
MFCSAVLVALSLFCATRADSPAASTVYFNDTGTTFSINLPTNSSDLYFSFSSPALSWVAVGAGATMRGSLMFIMYSTADGAGKSVHR